MHAYICICIERDIGICICYNICNNNNDDHKLNRLHNNYIPICIYTHICINA